MADQQGGSRRGRGAEDQPKDETRRGGRNEGQGATREGAGREGVARRDAEREMPVSRESSGEVGRRGGSQATPATGRTGGLARAGEPPSLMPAFMANPGLMASAFMRDPFAFAELMSDEMDRLFSNVRVADAAGIERGRRAGGGGALARGVPGRGAMRGGEWTPPLEVFQRGEELVVRADLPGVAVDDVSLDVEDGVLIISGERRAETEEHGEGFFRSERRYGTFTRTVALPDGVDEERIDASFRNGVLEVTVPLPKPEEQQRSRRIQVRSGEAVHGADAGAAAGESRGRTAEGGAGAGGPERRPGPGDPGAGKVGA